MSTEQLLAAARAVTDPLALLFLVGSIAMLWALWHVLVHDIDLTDGGDERKDQPETDPEKPADLVGGRRR